MTGSIVNAPNWKARQDGRTEVTLDMGPFDSVFVVFRKKTDSKGLSTPPHEYREVMNLKDNWAVRFDPVFGPREPVVFSKLMPWNGDKNDQLQPSGLLGPVQILY